MANALLPLFMSTALCTFVPLMHRIYTHNTNIKAEILYT